MCIRDRREIALWNYVNHEAVHKIRPHEITREGDIWFTKAKDNNAVYAFIPGGKDWKYGERKEFVFRTLQGTPETLASILGYASELVEYRPGYDAGIYVNSTPIGLVISAVNGHRLYTNNQWPNPVVLKIENASYRELKQARKVQSTIDGAR